jgi:hypothetical protein
LRNLLKQSFVLLVVFTISVSPGAAYQRSADLFVGDYRGGLSVFGLQRLEKAIYLRGALARGL